MVPDRWKVQEEAYQFAMSHPATMLDMEMGCGKTRVAIDVAFNRSDVCRVLIVCPKAVIGVWRENLQKFVPDSLDSKWGCWDEQKGTVKAKAESLRHYLSSFPCMKQFVVVNYDCVWRSPISDIVLNGRFNMVVLDESHRAKSPGSKVSKFLAILGRRVRYKMCLSGTPMANSPLDVYGQYRFLDPSIFGTNFGAFQQFYAVMGGPERRFVVGYKNQQDLKARFQSIAYSCKMSDVASRIKLPDMIPPIERKVKLCAKDKKTLRQMEAEFVAECGSGNVVVENVLTKMLRMQQITDGFCIVQDEPGGLERIEELNNVKESALCDLFEDISNQERIVVFCKFRHDLEAIHRAASTGGRESFELSGTRSEREEWMKCSGGVLAVQIQAGAEGVDMTCAHYAVYFSLPYSLAQYEQSKARLYRPGQQSPVFFIHVLAEETIDEVIYKALQDKRNLIDAIKCGSLDYEILKR